MRIQTPARNFYFTHINKTGGSSVERALGLRFEHKTALEKIAEVGQAHWVMAFTFSIVRNPWDKVVSHYHYRVQTNQTGLGTDPIDFREWVRRAYGENDPAYYNNPKMFMPQVDWLSDPAGNLLVKYIGRFENLATDFAAICANIGVTAALPHVKSSQRGDYRDYYDDASRDIVARWFGKDIERFGYAF